MSGLHPSSPASVDREESFLTALATVNSQSQNPARSPVKMFMITDTSPASPLVKQRSLHSPHAKIQDKKQIASPASFTSAITQSPVVSHSAASDEAKAVHSHASFDSSSVQSSAPTLNNTPSLLPRRSSEKPPLATPVRTVSTIQSSKVSRIPLSARGTNQSSSAEKEALVQFETPKLASTRSSARKATKSIVADFTPPPSKIPTRNRRTPSYARSTKASRRRSDWAKVPTVHKDSERGLTGLKAKRLTFSKTIPVSPEVLHRRTGRIRKIPSPKKNTSFRPNPTPRYLHKPRPIVRPTAKSEAVLHGPVQPEPLPVPRSLAAIKPAPTVSEPFNLGSVELHELRIMEIQARRRIEEEEDHRRRIVRPVKLQREILEGPTFVPNLDNKVLTVPVDPVPWAAERRERTLAFEAAQRARIEEMHAMKKRAQEMRDLAEEERLRNEYERNKFRARPVPRSHYNPDTPPKRRSSMAVVYMQEEMETRKETENYSELRSFFSNLDISEDIRTTTTSAHEHHDMNVRRVLSSKAKERKDLYSIVEQEHEIETSVDEHDSRGMQTIEKANKENVVPKSLVTEKTEKAGAKERKQSGLVGPMRIFNEIRNTLLGRQ